MAKLNPQIYQSMLQGAWRGNPQLSTPGTHTQTSRSSFRMRYRDQWLETPPPTFPATKLMVASSARQ